MKPQSRDRWENIQFSVDTSIFAFHHEKGRNKVFDFEFESPYLLDWRESV